MIACPKCFSALKQDDEFCKNCNALNPLYEGHRTIRPAGDSQPYECDACGAGVSFEDNVCPTCGADISEVDESVAGENTGSSNPVVQTKLKTPAITIGIIILVVGVALIIISPNFYFVEAGRPSQFDPWGWGNQRITDLRNVAMFFGVALLIVGGVISAVGFGIKKTLSTDQQRPGILLYRDGEQYGPYQMEAIMEWYKSGKLSEKDMVFAKGSNQWVPVAFFLGMDNSIITTPASNTTASLDDLEKLASLKAKGIITEVEYEKKKKQILGI